jgi:protein-tyrosine phosphatase
MGEISMGSAAREARMSLGKELKAFWWFIDDRVGGMGRPGFHQCHWYDLSLEEGLVFSWLGKQQQTALRLESLWRHLDMYGPKVALFYGLSYPEALGCLDCLRNKDVLLTVVDSMNAKANILQDVTWQQVGTCTSLHFLPNPQRLQHELALLKHHHVAVVISLLEQPLDQTALAAQFKVYYLAVGDVTPPSCEQVYTFANMLQKALSVGKKVATHCLAGVGRTTTMLLAAYLVQGYPWDALVSWVRTRNPYFQFKGSQATFLQALANDVSRGRLALLRAIKDIDQCQ